MLPFGYLSWVSACPFSSAFIGTMCKLTLDFAFDLSCNSFLYIVVTPSNFSCSFWMFVVSFVFWMCHRFWYASKTCRWLRVAIYLNRNWITSWYIALILKMKYLQIEGIGSTVNISKYWFQRSLWRVIVWKIWVWIVNHLRELVHSPFWPDLIKVVHRYQTRHWIASPKPCTKMMFKGLQSCRSLVKRQETFSWNSWPSGLRMKVVAEKLNMGTKWNT